MLALAMRPLSEAELLETVEVELEAQHHLAGMWLLTRYPEVQDRVRRDPSLIPGFIEEVLRFESPVQGLMRRATQDVELGGVVIPEDATVMIRYAAANRDELPLRFELA